MAITAELPSRQSIERLPPTTKPNTHASVDMRPTLTNKPKEIANRKIALPEPPTVITLRTLIFNGANAAMVDAWATNNYGAKENWSPQTTQQVADQVATIAAELRGAQMAVPQSLRALINRPQVSKAFALLDSHRAQSEIMLSAIARRGYDVVLDGLFAPIKSLVTGNESPASLRLNDAGRAVLHDHVALGTVIRDIRDGTLTPQMLGEQTWSDVDLMAVAYQRERDPSFDVRAEAEAMRKDPDFSKQRLTLSDAEGNPRANLDFEHLDRWGSRAQSSPNWLSNAGTQENLDYWHSLPEVKAVRERAAATAEVDASKRPQQTQIANLRTALSMARGDKLAAVLAPNLLATASLAAGIPITDTSGPRSSADLCRDLTTALAPGGTLAGPLDLNERQELETLVGPKDNPGADFEKRMSSEHWANFVRSLPETAVLSATVVMASLATGGAAAAAVTAANGSSLASAVAVALTGVVTSSAIADGLLNGHAPTVQSLVAGGLMAGAGSAANIMSGVLAKQLLATGSTNPLVKTVFNASANLASNVTTSAVVTSLNHFIASLQSEVPFSKNITEDLLRTMVSTAAGQATIKGLAKLENTEAAIKTTEIANAASRDEAAHAIREARRARDAYSESLKAVEGVTSKVATAAPQAHAHLAKEYLSSVAELGLHAHELGAALTHAISVTSKLPGQDQQLVVKQMQASQALLADSMSKLPKTLANPALAPSAKPVAELPTSPDPARVPRLNGLNANERDIETRFAQAYEKHPEQMVAELRGRMKQGQIGDSAIHFSPDEAKKLSPDFTGGPRAKTLASKLKAGETLTAAEAAELDGIRARRAASNLPLHTAAEALAMRAFLQRLDEMKADPAGPREVVIPVGGMGAGKSFAIQNNPHLKALSDRIGAIWDGAGERPDLLKVLAEVDKRGLKATVVSIDNDPISVLTTPGRGVVDRAMTTGRMSSLQLLGPSYQKSAEAVQAAQQLYGANDRVQFVYIDNRGKPTEVAGLRPEALQLNLRDTYDQGKTYLTGRSDLPSWLREAAIDVGERIWPTRSN